MKPIRVMRDVAHPKLIRGRNGKKTIFGNFRNAARGVFDSSGIKIPFAAGLALIIIEAACIVKIVPQMVPLSSPQLSGAEIIADTTVTVPKVATTTQDVVASSATSTLNATDSDALAEVQPGLLPLVKLPPFSATSTATSSKVSAVAKPIAVPQKPKSTPASTAITARSLLDATTLSMTERYDGPYKVTLTTNAGTYGKITWDLTQTVFTVSKPLPSFSESFSCNPPPEAAPAGAADDSPIFDMQTSYTCTASLTPTSGSDERIATKQFSFTTGAGQVVVTAPTSMNSLLQDGTNLGGLVFNNINSSPVTITGLDIDVAYTGLNIANNPLVLRVEDPVTNDSLDDVHLETLKAASAPYTYSGTDIHIPLSFTVGAASQKMLPLDLLGVQKLHIYGVDPSITITARNVTTDPNLNRTVLNAAEISWSCINPIGTYDPNATSGPYATGQACSQ